MKTEFLKLILSEIDVILSKEQKVSVDYPNDQILIAIGYLLHDDRVYFWEKDMVLEYKVFYF